MKTAPCRPAEADARRGEEAISQDRLDAYADFDFDVPMLVSRPGSVYCREFLTDIITQTFII